jgi:group I intron endonuclease
MIFNYNNNSNESGIYKIINTARKPNKVYIGQAQSFKKRWLSHKSALNCNRTRNQKFQNSFNLWKKELNHDDFLLFEVLEVMPNSTRKERNVREEFWLNECQNSNIEVYNINLEPTKEPTCWSSNPEETKQKLRKPKSAEHRLKVMSNPNVRATMFKPEVGFAKTFSESHKTNISEALKLQHDELSLRAKTNPNIIATQFSKENLPETSFKKGHIPWSKGLTKETNESLRKRSKKQVGRLVSEKTRKKLSDSSAKFYDIKLVSPLGEIFGPITNLKEFYTKHNLSKQIHSVINGKRNSHRGWKLFVV